MTRVLVLLLAVFPSAAVAQNRWERQVHDNLQRALQAARTPGSAPAVVTQSGMLNGDEAESFVVTLRAGVSYVILGVCDEDCSRLQLALMTLANSEIALERHSEGFPVLRFTPTATTQYRIRVVMEGCRMNPCWYGVGITPSS
jgi:hypothetical protein